MADLFREVDEVMRQERIEKFWKDNAGLIIAFIAGTILLTAAYSGYKSWNQSVNEEQTAQFLDLKADENFPQNILESENLDLRPGLRGLTYLNAGNAFLQADKPDEALKIFERAAQDKDLPADLMALNALMYVRLASNAENPDYAALKSTLVPIAGNTSNAYAAQAHLELAIIEAHGFENYDQAQAHLNAILEGKNIPQTLDQRARSLHSLYELKKTLDK